MCRTFDKHKAGVHKAVEFKISRENMWEQKDTCKFAKKNKLSEL